MEKSASLSICSFFPIFAHMFCLYFNMSCFLAGFGFHCSFGERMKLTKNWQREREAWRRLGRCLKVIFGTTWHFLRCRLGCVQSNFRLRLPWDQIWSVQMDDFWLITAHFATINLCTSHLAMPSMSFFWLRTFTSSRVPKVAASSGPGMLCSSCGKGVVWACLGLVSSPNRWPHTVAK